MELCSQLPAAPLKRAIVRKKRSLGMSWEELGHYLGVTERTLQRLMAYGSIGVYSADHMAIRLGLHPALLWPRAEELTERLWTVEDVAAFIRVPAATLRKWRHTGHPLGLLGVRVGKRVVWDPRDVRAWWERTKRAGVSGDPTAVIE